MSTKHFFPDTSGLIVQALQSLVARNPHLELDEPNRVVFNKAHEPSKVSIISGGGSGHEPAWSGFVGDGLLAAAVNGEVFASPSTKQVMAAIQNVPSDAGTILCITNYTGDKLHFGLAREKALALGHKIAVIAATDDVALGRKKSALVGRRGLAGNFIGLKLMGAASHQSWSFEDCLKLGTRTNDQVVTVGTSLDHCHIPGRGHHEAVSEDACVLGMGIHNEPGLRTLKPIPSADKIIKEMLLYLLDPSDEDRAFTQFESSDEVVLLINNFGGLSNLEMEAMTNITLQQLTRDWNIRPCRIYSGMFETSLNAPGFMVTLGNLSNIAKSLGRPVSDIVGLLDAPTNAMAWPKNAYENVQQSSRDTSMRPESVQEKTSGISSDKQGPPVSENLIRGLRQACKDAIAAEPDITKYDIQMGDGDCGEAVEGVCRALLAKLDSGSHQRGSLFDTLDSIGDTVEDMGGSLGAIISILLTAFCGKLRQVSKSSNTFPDVVAVGHAAGDALENLKQYTGARVGDRTAMDALIPFCETLAATSSLDHAMSKAEHGASATANMKPKFGRATYVGDKVDEESMPPDPGAWAVVAFLRGLVQGLARGDV
ncbi:dihydroxyacetone kinase-like protein [Saccharata proteae CBS 121410]|uniref:Dihydroxyacetone kinase-like protein n=1 Tax=Saccharata proteae CBS 121410 TaxID=1314787 RepID=A0A9P4HYY1_9PEZI|nr:dihydroxyacetone kinase-like protein [Saccharata proteae CBS 121410]